MFVLGLLVLAAAVVGAVELILANRQPLTIHMWNWTWHVDAFWLAVIGAVVITAAWLALGAMRIAATHQMRMRRERRDLAAENKRLAERVQHTDAKAARHGANRPAQAPQYVPPPAPAQGSGSAAGPATEDAAPTEARR